MANIKPMHANRILENRFYKGRFLKGILASSHELKIQLLKFYIKK